MSCAGSELQLPRPSIVSVPSHFCLSFELCAWLTLKSSTCPLRLFIRHSRTHSLALVQNKKRRIIDTRSLARKRSTVTKKIYQKKYTKEDTQQETKRRNQMVDGHLRGSVIGGDTACQSAASFSLVHTQEEESLDSFQSAQAAHRSSVFAISHCHTLCVIHCLQSLFN